MFKHSFTEVFSLPVCVFSATVQPRPLTHIPLTSGGFWLSSKREKLQKKKKNRREEKRREKRVGMQLCVVQGGENIRKAKRRKTGRTK